MIGERVEHPQFGSGQVVATFSNGHEWLVRFGNGLRFRRPRVEFEGQTAADRVPAPLGTFTPPPPASPERLAARRFIESLRLGIAPADHVAELTIGLADEQASLQEALSRSETSGGDARAVVGEYGFGKSHLVELTAQQALARNFLVATVSLDLRELPPHRGFAIYREAMTHLRYPDSDERGLQSLLRRSADTPSILPQLRALSPAELDPLVVGLHVLSETTASRRRRPWLNWLAGGQKPRSMRGMPRGVKFPSIYKVGHNQRQIAYLFTAISALARLNGYSGLCLLVDEAESYSLLYPYQRPKASALFQALIYAALQQEQDRIAPDHFPQHRWRDYPLTYGEGQGFFFLFTVTRSDNRMPLGAWLDEARIFSLEPHVSPQAVGRLLERVLDYHALAFEYEPGERPRQVRRGAAELLAHGLRHGQLTMRQTVRLSVELFDLLHLHPAYTVATLLDELRARVR